MKTAYLLMLSLSISLISCAQSGETGTNSNGTSGAEAGVNSTSGKYSKTLIMQAIKNPQTGELMGHIPLPKTWKIEGGWIVGPNGIKTADYPNKYFPFEQRWVIPLEQVVREDIAQEVANAGGKILGTFVIPELENYDRAYFDLLWSFGNPQNEFHALGVDLQTPDGNRSLLIFRQLVTRSQYGNSWGYYINAMDANTDAYEEAKSDYIFALTHLHPNMEQIQRHNQSEIAKSNASWAAHSQRMAANQAAFNARNQAWMESSNAISDMSMKGWRERNKMTDAGHASSINSINEEQTITNQYGESVQVEAGSNRYFTNGNNEYIRTDDYLYNPNLDNKVNNYEWKEWGGN